MGKIINAALAVGFAVALERGVKAYLERRDAKRAVAKASKTGFGTTTPEPAA